MSRSVDPHRPAARPGSMSTSWARSRSTCCAGRKSARPATGARRAKPRSSCPSCRSRSGCRNSTYRRSAMQSRSSAPPRASASPARSTSRAARSTASSPSSGLTAGRQPRPDRRLLEPDPAARADPASAGSRRGGLLSHLLQIENHPAIDLRLAGKRPARQHGYHLRADHRWQPGGKPAPWLRGPDGLGFDADLDGALAPLIPAPYRALLRRQQPDQVAGVRDRRRLASTRCRSRARS